MKKEERQQLIINLLETHNSYTTSQLAEELGVSPMTIRRDLAYLEDKNLIKRTHGLAYTANIQDTLDVDTRHHLNPDEKLAIAQKALSLIQPNQSIILDSGSTIYFLAKLLKQHQLQRLVVLTNSLTNAEELSDSYQTLLCGGILQATNMSLIGPEAENFFATKTADILFLGATGIRSSFGLTTSDPFQYSIKKKMIHSAQRVVALVDSYKFQVNSLNMFCEYHEIDTLITRRTEQNEQELDTIASHGVNVLLIND